MLHPKHNRIDYGDQLIPPQDYELSFAVGTTYSLDLEALMILPVSLFYAQKLDGSPDELRYDMLDAITKASDKITVYYQNGQLKVPQKYHHLMAYWENGIQAITMPNYNSSFHPKVWIIRYESKELPTKYRVLVTSRNLTFTRDWDVAFSTDGMVSDKEQTKNKPLIHFLEYLHNNGNKKIPNSFINDLRYVKFELPDKFDSLKFIPIGIPNVENNKIYNNPLTCIKTNWDEMLIISPFIDKSTLNSIYETCNKAPYVLSRKEELDAIDEEILDSFQCWEFSRFFQEVEFSPNMEDGGPEPIPQNLHAKMFVAMKDRIPYWYLGSANCTNPAQERNVEFMVELKAVNTSGFKAKNVLKILTDPNKADGISLFTPYDNRNRDSVNAEKSIDQEIRRIKYELTKLELTGSAELIEGGKAYSYRIQIDARDLTLPNGYKVNIKPLSENSKNPETIVPKSINKIDTFGGYSETALSIYLVFEIEKDNRVYSEFLLPMQIELPSTRLNRIFTSIIDSREKFLKYLTFLLSGEESDLIKDTITTPTNKLDNSKAIGAFAGLPIYEKLLIASSRFPEMISSIDSLIQKLKEEKNVSDEPIVSPEFEEFWSVFQTFNKKMN